ncbi:hypothetical protein D4764_03G0010600 [Takifugu flavidus]|uniref:E3 ubiquitin-protein ligase TRIM32 n=1 Tax=Takifugu flavidus TaxID=433684 RepID=A0A5C6N977_9TELE|nr:hypothetical protein D4764_03G0010600 [Takifugu flavidus]
MRWGSDRQEEEDLQATKQMRQSCPGKYNSALLTHSTPKERDSSSSSPHSCSPGESPFTPISFTLPPPWVTQALSNLEQGERELLSLRERQQTEVEDVNHELDNAMFEAQREERRLLEKVEQEHREAQRYLSQVKRENAAAVRVVQSLVDQQLRKIGQLKEQIQRWGSSAGRANKNQLQRGVAEVTQPWEISLTLKRVSFLTNPGSKALRMGEVDVREQNMTYPIGVCGVQGQKCALHSGDKAFSNTTPLEIRKEPPPNRAGQRHSPEERSKSNGGNTRVVRKLRLSSSTEDEEHKLPAVTSPPPRGVSESSQEEEVESVCSDLFPAVPPVSSQGESGDDESDGRQREKMRRSTLKGKKKQRAAVLVSLNESSRSLDETDGRSDSVAASPKVQRSTLRHSLTELSTGHQPRLPKGSHESSVDSSSEDSCSTCTGSTAGNGPHQQESFCSVSTCQVLGQIPPLVNGSKEHRELRKVTRVHLTSECSTLEYQSCTECDTSSDELRLKACCSKSSDSTCVGGALSVSTMEGNILQQRQESQQLHETPEERGAPSLKEQGDEGSSAPLDSAHLIKQFGRQGSGRTDFNLPTGVHANAKGQLFVVDCGNARVQVTDLQKNVVQQVSPSGSERSSRICNYFDVAVNSKGLIALTCAAERAVLVFSRHGRLLQTFGGSTIGSTNEELDAPRGVTVTREDEFLVADIKRGSLTSLKLDPKTGVRLERTVVTGYHRPYLVAACISTGLIAVSERGNETGRVACIRVLEPGWNTIRILGVCSGLGPVLTSPWGLGIDSDGDVLVADWGKQHHRVLLYPATGVGWPLVTDNLSSPRGLALLPDGHMVVSDSMNHCIKIYRYK